jgi:uncharacterized protein YwqG
MIDAEFATLLSRHHLDHWSDRLLATEQASVRLEALGDGRQIARLGGAPRLGPDDVWPEADGNALAFIAEVDLAAAASLLGEGILPRNGHLEFFYDAEQSVWGFDPADHPKWRVLWAGDDAAPRDFPEHLPENARFAPVALGGRIEKTFVDFQSWQVHQMGIDMDTRLRYTDALDEWKAEPDDATIHRLLGHPDPIQGDMMLECQLASNGINVGGGPREPSELETKLEAGARDWRLLLQIDSDERSNMMWGDVGRIYYWIREQDLRERKWHRVWMVLQCY